MGTCTISRRDVFFLDSRVLSCGSGDEELEEEMTEMTSWRSMSLFLLRYLEGEERKRGVF